MWECILVINKQSTFGDLEIGMNLFHFTLISSVSAFFMRGAMDCCSGGELEHIRIVDCLYKRLTVKGGARLPVSLCLG